MKLKITKEEREGLKNTFKNFDRKKTKKQTFYDLCFCICAPQTTFKNNIAVIQDLKRFNLYKRKDVRYTKLYGEYYIPKLRALLKPVRFYNNKARYLLEAKVNFDKIMYHIKVYKKHRHYKGHAQAMRDYLVDDVKGLGMKAASHFMRNLGDRNLAIIDVHIIKFLAEHVTNFTSHPTTYDLRLEIFSKYATNKNDYKWLEYRFKDIAVENNLSVAALDALVWQRYSKTPWENFKY